MTCYRIVVAYDGTNYHGWQMQPDAATITQVLTKSFFSTFSHKVSIVGASRTDAGVHALAQVAIARSPISIPVVKLKKAWNNALPQDILIKSVELLDELVHPHTGVIQKTYMYHFFTEQPLPFVQRYGWYFNRPLNLDLLKKSLKIFVGTHDFRSFCTGDEVEDTVRTVDSIELQYLEDYGAYRIIVKGKGFLRYMIRRIVGACFEIASRESLTLENLKTVLINKNPCHTLPNAPAKGLLLYEIRYKAKGEI